MNKSKLFALFSLTLLIASLTGCNTVSGIGKDVKAGGQAIENAADKSK